MFAAAYPFHVDGALDRHLSRSVWLVKSFLAIPTTSSWPSCRWPSPC